MMFSRLKVQHREYRNPQHTLNEIKPFLYAMQVVIEMEGQDRWTHSQRAKFNFVISELLSSVNEKIIGDTVSMNKTNDFGDIGDIPF